MALFCVAILIPIAAIGIDLGMQRVVRRDMQALADVAALDVARNLDGRPASAYDLDALHAAANTTRDRNGDTLGDVPAMQVELGVLDEDDGEFRSVSGTTVPTAVRVTAAGTVGYVVMSGDGAATRSAVAESIGGACFRIGSYAAALDTSSSPLLGDLLEALGSNVNLTAGDYNALADAEIGLLGLLGTNVGAVSMEEALDLPGVSLADFYLASAKALAAQSGETAAVTALQALALGVSAVNVPLGELLQLGTGGASGLDAGLNALDLVTAAAALATRENGVSIPRVGVNLGPLANVQSSVSIIEPPKVGCGRKNDPLASGQSAAARVDLSAAALNLNLGILATKVSLHGEVRLASARGQLTDVRCNPEGISVAVQDGLVEVDLTLEVNISAIFGLIPAVSGPIRITGSGTSTGDAVKVINVDEDYDTPVRVGNSSSGLPKLHTDFSGLRALGLPLGVVVQGIVLGPLTNLLVNPLIASLDGVLTPLLRSLGLDVSGADVFAIRVPKCDDPALRG